MTTDAEIIEAMARAICEALPIYRSGWDKQGPVSKAIIRNVARAAFSACAPAIRAQAMEEAARLRAALEQIAALGSDGTHSGDRHARCREIAWAALAPPAVAEKGDDSKWSVSPETQAFMDAEKQRLGVSTNSELLRAKLRELREPKPAVPISVLAEALARAAEQAAERGWDYAAERFPTAPPAVAEKGDKAKMLDALIDEQIKHGETLRDLPGEVIEKAMAICDLWLHRFAEKPVETIPAHLFAADAVRDIRDGIAALLPAVAEKGSK